MFGFFVAFASGERVARFSSHVALYKRHAVSPLLEKAELVHRAKRQSPMRLGPREPEQCVLDCMETMDEKLKEAFPEVANKSSDNELADALLKSDYDPEKFEQFCDIYTPSARCLDRCPKSEVKKIVQKGLAMLQYMCVDKYDDFRKHGPCMDKAGKEIDQICGEKCKEYGESVQKLEKLTEADNVEDYEDDNVNALLSQTCNFVDCLMQCDQPIMAEKCGKAAADLERDTVRVAFRSLSDVLETAPNGGIWPESCAKLGRDDYRTPEFPAIVPSHKTTSSNATEVSGMLSREIVNDGDED